MRHNPAMVTSAIVASPDASGDSPSGRNTATVLLDILEHCLHAARSEWLFFRELRVGTGRRNRNVQRLDAFALNSLPHTAMKRICYEVKTSRADFLAELKHPLKRRIGMRYSNEFYFVTPGEMVDIREIPVECGLVEAGLAKPAEWRRLVQRQAGFFSFDAETRRYCMLTVPAPWRETPGRPGNCWPPCCATSGGNWRRSSPHHPLNNGLSSNDQLLAAANRRVSLECRRVFFSRYRHI